MACAAGIKKNDRENHERGYESQIEDTSWGGKMKIKRGHIQSNDQPDSQVDVIETPNNTKEEYLQLQFIPSLQSERIPIFEASLLR